MDELQDVLGLEDLLADDGQLALPRRVKGRSRTNDAMFTKPRADDEPYAPTTSWWVGSSSRDEFRKRAEERQEAMQQSTFGKQRGLLPKDIW